LSNRANGIRKDRQEVVELVCIHPEQICRKAHGSDLSGAEVPKGNSLADLLTGTLVPLAATGRMRSDLGVASSSG
jgi:hypothetical protein